MRQRQSVRGEQARSEPHFMLRRLEKLAPRRHVEKQIFDPYRGAGGTRDRLQAFPLAAFDHDLRAVVCRACARGQRHARHLRDAGQRLAAKAKRVDRIQVGRRAQFARSVAGEGQWQIVSLDAAAVVENAQRPIEPAVNLHRDLRRPGVERVLEQFLQHRDGAIDGFARGDVRDHLGRKLRDTRSVDGATHAELPKRSRNSARALSAASGVRPFTSSAVRRWARVR